MMDSFLLIFWNISEQLSQGTPSDGYFLKVFVPRKQLPESVRKAALKKWEISEGIVRWGIYTLILPNKTTPPLMVSWEFCEILEQLF